MSIVLPFRGLFPGIVGKDDPRIAKIFSVGKIAVYVDGLAIGTRDRIVRVLTSDTLRLFLESLDSGVRPPIPQTTSLVILCAGVVYKIRRDISLDRDNLGLYFLLTKGVTQLVSSHGTECAVLQVQRPVG